MNLKHPDDNRLCESFISWRSANVGSASLCVSIGRASDCRCA